MMSWSSLDWVIVLIIVFSAIQAISSGFFREFFAFVGVIAGYLIAAWEYPVVAAVYTRFINESWPAQIAAFFTIFVLVAVIAGVLGKVSSRVVRGVGLGFFDRLFGAVFGFLRGVVVSVIVVMALAALAPQWGISQSRIAPYMLTAGRTLLWAAPPDFRQRFWDGWKLLRTVPEHFTRDEDKDSKHQGSTP